MNYLKILLGALIASTCIGCARASLTGGFEQSATQIETSNGIALARDVKDAENLAEIDNDRSYNPHANDADNWRTGAHYGGGYGYRYGWGWNRYYGYRHRCFNNYCR